MQVVHVGDVAIDAARLNSDQGRCPTSSLAGGVWVRLPTASPDDIHLVGASTRCAAAAGARTRRPKCPVPPLPPPTPSALLASRAPLRRSRALPATAARCRTSLASLPPQLSPPPTSPWSSKAASDRCAHRLPLPDWCTRRDASAAA